MVFAFHDGDEIGPVMLSKIAKTTGITPDDPDAAPTLARGHAALCASAASGTSPPAGTGVRRKTTPLGPRASKALHFDKPLCASLDPVTLHAATRAGALDARAREAVRTYDRRPPLAQDRVTEGPEGLVRFALKRPFADDDILARDEKLQHPEARGMRPALTGSCSPHSR